MSLVFEIICSFRTLDQVFLEEIVVPNDISQIDFLKSIFKELLAEELLDLISERPAVNELKEMTTYIYSRMNALVDSVNNIVNDDKRLEEVYSRLRDL